MNDLSLFPSADDAHNVQFQQMPLWEPLSTKSQYGNVHVAPQGLVPGTIGQVVTSSVSTFYTPVTWPCRVPGCPRLNCNLRSHQQYGSLSLRQSEIGGPLRGITRTFAANQTWSTQFLPQQIQREGFDGNCHLSVASGLDPGLEDLFTHFFTTIFDRMTMIFRPLPISRNLKARRISLARSNPAYCMATIMKAKIETDRARGQSGEDAQSLSLYNQVMRLYQEQLLTARDRQVDVFLFIVVVLIDYDLVHGKIQSARTHWAGMQQLVSWGGGLHNLDESLYYVVHVDRLVATFNNQRPAYPLPADRSIQLMRPPRCVYGVAFEIRSLYLHIMSESTLEYCIDACRLVELFESTRMSFDPRKSLPAPLPEPLRDVGYFYYSRDRLDGQFALFHADLHGQHTMEECIVLAVRLAEYPLTWSNQNPQLPTFLCTQLQQALQTHRDLLTTWAPYLDILKWILGVAVLVPTPWPGRDWVVRALCDVLSARYGDRVWADGWRQVEWRNARRFVWSDLNLRSRFDDACDELEAVRRARSTPTTTTTTTTVKDEG